MNRTQFEHLLLLHGSAIDEWPPDAAAAARDLLAHDREARRLLDEACALDASLGAAMPADPGDAALTGRVLDHVRARAGRAVLRPVDPSSWWLPGWGSGFAIVAVAGFALGFFAVADPAADESVLLALAGGDATIWVLP